MGSRNLHYSSFRVKREYVKMGGWSRTILGNLIRVPAGNMWEILFHNSYFGKRNSDHEFRSIASPNPPMYGHLHMESPQRGSP